jgi:preprotein translocase SecE subunit
LTQNTESRTLRSAGLVIFAALGGYLGYSLFAAFPPSSDAGLFSWSSISGVGILVLSIVIGFVVLFGNKKTALFFYEVETESRKVNWPDWVTVKSSTGQVIVVMLFLLAYLFVVDLVLVHIRDFIL